MANFQPKEIDLSKINGGQRYKNGQGVSAEAINNALEASAYAQKLAQKTFAPKYYRHIVEIYTGTYNTLVGRVKFCFECSKSSRVAEVGVGDIDGRDNIVNLSSAIRSIYSDCEILASGTVDYPENAKILSISFSDYYSITCYTQNGIEKFDFSYDNDEGTFDASYIMGYEIIEILQKEI